MNQTTTPADTSSLPAILTIHEVAARYQTTTDTIYRFLRKGSDFPRPIPLPTSGIRWRVDMLDQWERAKAAEAAQNTGKAA
jgi:predicted DNA-binding transcriptional regulator AlpA